MNGNGNVDVNIIVALIGLAGITIPLYFAALRGQRAVSKSEDGNGSEGKIYHQLYRDLVEESKRRQENILTLESVIDTLKNERDGLKELVSQLRSELAEERAARKKIERRLKALQKRLGIKEESN